MQHIGFTIGTVTAIQRRVTVKRYQTACLKQQLCDMCMIVEHVRPIRIRIRRARIRCGNVEKGGAKG